jgi:hypothetical protein
MNINRNNYEEYFLLYADKELSAEEKSMVEMFVQQNPDLEEEFVMLQQSVVKPDNTIELKDKSFLFKKELLQQAQYINQNNYEEKFLLYTDNELSLSEIEETEKFALSNSSLQNEFTLLQQVKYIPDTTIVFPDKSFLYKNEDNGKVIPFRWKTLAAAVLLGIGLWTGISYLQENKTKSDVATSQPVPKENNAVKPIEQKVNSKYVPLVKTADNENTLTPKAVPKERDNSVQKQIAPRQDVTVKNIDPTDKRMEVDKKIEQKREDVVINEVPNTNDVIKTNELPQPIVTAHEPTDKALTKMPALENNNYAQTASYIADAEVKNENYVFYNITTEEFRKSKVGNFLKKVKRSIERKIPFKNNIFKSGTAELEKDYHN